MVKSVKKRGEDGKVALRNIRRDAIEKLKKMEKSGELSEDDAKRDQEKMQKITDKYSDEIDALVNTKTEEITEI